MVSIISNAFTDAAGNTFDNLMGAYYVNGDRKVPSKEDLRKIELGIVDMRTAGTETIIGGLACFGTAIVLWNIPYGELLAVPIGVASLAASILGYDVRKSSYNLKEFSSKRFEKIPEKVFNKDVIEETSEDFKRLLYKTAKQGTIILRFSDQCWI